MFNICFLVVLAAIVYAAPDTPRNFALDTSSFGTTNLLKMMPSAGIVNQTGALRVCKSAHDEIGAVWIKRKVFIRGFTTSFSFRFTQAPDNSSDGNEGIAFVIHTDPSDWAAQGARWSGMNYGSIVDGSMGIKNSLALEFDTHYDPDLGDPKNNHVSLHARPGAPNSANEQYSIFRSSGIPKLADGNIHTASITFIPVVPPNGSGYMTLFLDTLGAPVFNLSINMPTYVPMSEDGVAWVGFTAAGGNNSSQDHDLLSWSYNFLGVVTASNTIAYGAGLGGAVAGNVEMFVIQGIDQFHNNITFGGDMGNFSITLEGDPNAQISMYDNNDGTYTVEYNTTLSESTNLHIVYGGVDISGSPIALTVEPGDPFGPDSVASQQGAQTGLSGGAAGTNQQFTLALFDVYGNQIVTPSPQSALSATVGNQNVKFAYTNNGLYTGSYTLTTVGTFTLEIQVDGVDISNPTFQIIITPGAVNGSVCVATGADQGGFAGEVNTFTVQLKDNWGNNIVTNTNPTFVIRGSKSSDKSNFTGTVSYTTNGIFSAQYVAQKSGTYSMIVSVNGKQIVGSPFTVRINPARYVYPPNCVASGAGLGGAAAGAWGVLFVDTKDAFNNTITAQQNLTWNVFFTLNGQITDSIVNVTFVNRRYQIAYNETLTAKYLLNIQINESNIMNSPFPVQISPAPAYGSSCTATGDGLVTSVTDQPVNFVVTSYDRYKNPTGKGGDSFEVSVVDPVNGNTGSVTEDDLLNGQYQFTYTIAHSGQYQLSVTLNGQNIVGSPFTIDCRWAGLSTEFIFIFSGIGVFLVIVAFAGFWIYRKRRQRHLYVPLRDNEIGGTGAVSDLSSKGATTSPKSEPNSTTTSTSGPEKKKKKKKAKDESTKQ